ncbi:MAG TPA: hypothetical protein VH478_16080 [Trebonia sp.]|jgi:hypothetical protein|nr:hypothetical protein [Trebonia sp.]
MQIEIVFIFIFAFITVRFWRAALTVFLGALVTLALLGLITLVASVVH